MAHFIELEKTELLNINGGLPGWTKTIFKSITGVWIADQIIDNWDAIKEGFAEGWNSIGK